MARSKKYPQARMEEVLPPSLAGTRPLVGESPMPDLMRRNPKIGFGRVVMPYFFNLDPNDYKDITTSMVKAIAAEKIAPVLHRPHSEFAMNRVDNKGRVIIPSREYKAIARSPKHLDAAINTDNFEKFSMDKDIERRTNRAEEEARRGLLSKLDVMKTAARGIAQERATAEALATQASHPGYAHTPFLDMLIMVSAVREIYFPQILDVAGREKGWTSEQRSLAGRALDVSLFMSGTERIMNFRGWTDMEVDYVTERADLFEDRISTVSNMLGIPLPQYEGPELSAIS